MRPAVPRRAGAPWNHVMWHHSHDVKGNGLPISLPRTLCWFSQWSWSVESDPQWSCGVGTTPEPMGPFWSPGVLETEPDMGDAHTWGSAALTQHFRRVLKCLAQRDTDKRGGPVWSCPSPGESRTPRESIVAELPRRQVQMRPPAGSAQHCQAAPLATTAYRALPLGQPRCSGLAWSDLT